MKQISKTHQYAVSIHGSTNAFNTNDNEILIEAKNISEAKAIFLAKQEIYNGQYLYVRYASKLGKEARQTAFENTQYFFAE